MCQVTYIRGEGGYQCGTECITTEQWNSGSGGSLPRLQFSVLSQTVIASVITDIVAVMLQQLATLPPVLHVCTCAQVLAARARRSGFGVQ